MAQYGEEMRLRTGFEHTYFRPTTYYNKEEVQIGSLTTIKDCRAYFCDMQSSAKLTC